MKPSLPLSHSLKKRQKKSYNEIWVEPLGPLRADKIFAYISRELDKNCEDFSKKVREMVCSAV